jgi:hypothetical protein
MATQPDPIREWREQYARRCLRVDFEPSPGSTFKASVKSIFPELRIVRAALSPGFLYRDDDLLRDGDDSIGFVVAQSRELTARHLGREVELSPGDAEAKLSRFIANPDEIVPGNNMKPYGGLASADDRAKVIAFLQSLTK